MITLSELVGPWSGSVDWTPERQRNAVNLLAAVNPFLDYYTAVTGNKIPVNNFTKSIISGQTLGGFRPQICAQGAPNSAHKQGLAVDIYDPENLLDKWITDEILAERQLYREAPESTPRWCHLTIRAPGSGKRTFHP